MSYGNLTKWLDDKINDMTIEDLEQAIDISIIGSSRATDDLVARYRKRLNQLKDEQWERDKK